jgi:hypothetical protein
VSTRLAVTLAIPVVGLLVLLAGIAFLADEGLTLEYRGVQYVGGEVLERAPGAEAVPTDDTVGGRQVWLTTLEHPEYDLYLQLPDGRFQGFRREE